VMPADAEKGIDAQIILLGTSAMRMLDVPCPACPRLSTDSAGKSIWTWSRATD